MKAVRLENFKTKTPPGKSAEEWRRKKKNLTGTGWSSAPAESGETGGKDTGTAGTPPERRPTYSETMQGYYGDRYADALAENKTAADAAAETAERDAQDALERIRGGYKSTDRQLYREYMESKRTLPQRLAAQGITGGLTESSQVRLANSYGEELAENERARLAEEAKTYSARDARLAAARAEQSRADAEAKGRTERVLPSSGRRRKSTGARTPPRLPRCSPRRAITPAMSAWGSRRSRRTISRRSGWGGTALLRRCAARGTTEMPETPAPAQVSPTRFPSRFSSKPSAARTPPWSISPRSLPPAPSGATRRRRSGSCSALRGRVIFNFQINP